MSTVTLGSPVSTLYGIGPEAERRLKKIDIETVYDLISYLPRRYDDWSRLSKIIDYKDGEPMSFTAHLTSNPVRKGTRRTSPVSFFVSDSEGRMELTFFNAPYIAGKFSKGDNVFVHGTVSMFGGRPQMVNPHVEKADSTEGMDLIRPVYPLTAGITSNQLRRWIKTALGLVSDQIRNVIPPDLVLKEGLCSAKDAYNFVHFPEELSQAYEGRRRIAYEELILLGIGMKRFMKNEGPEDRAPQVIPRSSSGLPADAGRKWNMILGNLGFELTADQKAALRDIQTDLMKTTPMNRLVQGDVGSGKTAVAVLAMAMTALMGKQAVLLAPTSVLAKQHYESASSMLRGSGINVALLLGKTKASLKKEIKEQLRDNTASVIIGTHALLSDDVNFSDLALVIADEQHRFGVKQREKLLISREDEEDGVNSVHNLVMTATPIPRTLAMVIYGDMDTSVIKNKPAGRREIKTNFLPDTSGNEIFEAVRAKLRLGQQAYIVCPRIDDDDDDVMWKDVFPDEGIEERSSFARRSISVKEMMERLEASGLAGEFKCEMLYGSMKESEKLDVMERFLSNETQVLVSTTVIEVGVNNPNATMMIIMDADRFGLSTLHQLRGRIGRGDKQSYCILVSDNRSELSLQRMKLMCECSDGFVLAGKDLELRGPGDFFGTRQHGIPQLRAANLFTDSDKAKTACDSVNELAARGGSEASEIMDNIRFMFDLRFKEKLGTL